MRTGAFTDCKPPGVTKLLARHVSSRHPEQALAKSCLSGNCQISGNADHIVRFCRACLKDDPSGTTRASNAAVADAKRLRQIQPWLCCYQKLNCTSSQPCIDCWVKFYWVLPPCGRASQSRHYHPAASGHTLKHHMLYVRRFAQDNGLAEHLLTGRGSNGDIVVLRNALDAERLVGYIDIHHAFCGQFFHRYYNLFSATPRGEPASTADDASTFTVLCWKMSGHNGYWRDVSLSTDVHSFDFLCKNNQLCSKLRGISMTQGSMAAARQMSVEMRPIVAKSDNEKEQQLLFHNASCHGFGRAQDELLLYIDTEFLTIVGHVGHFASSKLITSWGYVLAYGLSGRIVERGSIHGSDPAAAWDEHVVVGCHTELSTTQALLVKSKMVDLYHKANKVCIQWNRSAESSFAFSIFGDRRIMQDLMQQIMVMFSKGTHRFKYSVDVLSFVLGLDGRVQGVAHDDPDFDAETIALIGSLLRQAHYERTLWPEDIQHMAPYPCLLQKVRPPSSIGVREQLATAAPAAAGRASVEGEAVARHSEVEVEVKVDVDVDVDKEVEVKVEVDVDVDVEVDV